MIDLPGYPAPNAVTPRLVDFGAVLRPPLGGPLQRIERMGNRHAASFSFPPMPHAKLGRIWISRLMRAMVEGARLPWPLLGFDPGLPGSPVVDGTGQTGRTLAVRDAQPNYIFREGQAFSVQTNGRHHLMFVDAEVIADASGNAELAISPMLRVPHLDGDACHFSKPMFEGLIQGDALQWEMQLGNFNSFGIDIEEVA